MLLPTWQGMQQLTAVWQCRWQSASGVQSFQSWQLMACHTHHVLDTTPASICGKRTRLLSHSVVPESCHAAQWIAAPDEAGTSQCFLCQQSTSPFAYHLVCQGVCKLFMTMVGLNSVHTVQCVGFGVMLMHWFLASCRHSANALACRRSC